MVAANERASALVSAHSFVRSLKEIVCPNHLDGPYDQNLGLTNVCFIIFHGIGGRTVNKMGRNNLGKIRSAAPNIDVLELGSNGLCDRDVDPETIALSIVAPVQLLLKERNLRFIAVCEVTARQNGPFDGYNEEAALLNNRLKKSFIREIPAGKCWQHRGLIKPKMLIYMFRCYIKSCWLSGGIFKLLSHINFTSGTGHPVFLCSSYNCYNTYCLQQGYFL